jgi:hypothetical protein
MVSLGQYVRFPRETIQLQSMFVVRERPFNYSLCSLSGRDYSTTVYVHCPRENIQRSLSENEQSVVEWSLSDNEQTVVEWSLTDNEHRLLLNGLSRTSERDHSTTVCSLSERSHSTTVCSLSERGHSTTVCSLSERDHSTTVYVRCPKETIELPRTTNRL